MPQEYSKITLLLEFMLNLYTFSLIIELIIIPVAILFSLIVAILDTSLEFQNEDSKSIKKIIGFLSTGLGIFIMVNSVRLIIVNYRNVGTIDNLRALLLPVILSSIFVGFSYLFAVWSGYEQIFIRIGYGESKSTALKRYIKIKIVMFCGLNISKVHRFWRKYGLKIHEARDKMDFIKILKK